MTKVRNKKPNIQKLVPIVAKARPVAHRVPGDRAAPIRGLQIVLRLAAEIELDGPHSRTAERILSGLFRLALKQPTPPHPTVIEHPLRGLANAEEVVAAWPVVRALAFLQLAQARGHLRDKDQGLDILTDAGAAVLLHAMGDEGTEVLQALVGSSLTGLPDEMRSTLWESLRERPPRMRRYIPTGADGLLRGFLRRSVNRRRIDLTVQAKASTPPTLDFSEVDESLSDLMQPPEPGPGADLPTPSARTIWRYRAEVAIADPQAVQVEQVKRYAAARHQRDDAWTGRQVARALGIAQRTFVDLLKRAKADGFTASVRDGAREWFTVADVKRLRQYILKPPTPRKR